ncbi:MAG: hypothetical protein HUU55_17080 [Myxococcales bacterium]|nr:hypothetical protein [Myxococcales bacterium]
MNDDAPPTIPNQVPDTEFIDGEYRIVGAAKRVLVLHRDYTLLERDDPPTEIEKPKNVRPNLKVATGPMPKTAPNRPQRKVGRTMSDIKV